MSVVTAMAVAGYEIDIKIVHRKTAEVSISGNCANTWFMNRCERRASHTHSIRERHLGIHATINRIHQTPAQHTSLCRIIQTKKSENSRIFSLFLRFYRKSSSLLWFFCIVSRRNQCQWTRRERGSVRVAVWRFNFIRAVAYGRPNRVQFI